MHIIQYMTSPIPTSYQSCIDNVRASIGDIPYTLHTSAPFEVEQQDDPRYATDLVRLRLAADNPDMVWIDADTKIGPKGIFVPPADGFPYFMSSGGAAEIAVFYVNGNTDFFKEMLAAFDAEPKLHHLFWPQYMINARMRGRYKLIPDGHFVHLGLHRTI